MHKKYYVLAVLLTLFIAGFRNLGIFFDVTQPPQKADLIVSLGGDFNMERVQKALELYDQNLSASGKLILTGPITRTHELPNGAKYRYLTEHGVDRNAILMATSTKNTLAEVRYIKSYMLAHNLKHVLIVSYPAHSRRIDFFADTVFDYTGSGLHYTIVGTDHPTWNREFYYFDSVSLDFTIDELMKYIYYQLAYWTHILDTAP